MPQLHLYVPDDMAKLIRRRAREEGVSVSRYLARVIERELGPDWPSGYFDRVVGKWKGAFPKRSQGELERRASF